MPLYRTALRAAAVSAAVLLCAVPALPQTAQDVELTLPQVRDLAQRALAAGEPALALKLAEGLWTADPKSSYAHYIAAHAYAMQGRLGPARRAAGRAYRHAQSDPRRFEAAELAAKLSYDEGRHTWAQIWLRRAVQNAPDDRVEAQLGRDYGRVRRENPLSFSLRGGLKPSNNINNGSENELLTVDGVPTGGMIRGSALALSGLVGSMDATLSYRLRASEQSRTDIRARVYVQRVRLTDSAKEIASVENLGNSDFGLTYATVGIDHFFALGKTGSAAVGFTAGQLWYGGDHYNNFAKIDAARHWQIEGLGRLTVEAAYETRNVLGSEIADADIYTLGMSLTHRRENGDRLSLSFGLNDTQSRSLLVESQSASLGARYSFGEQMGPVKLSAGLTLGYAEYDRYTVLRVDAVPRLNAGARQDKSIIADASLFFPDYDYMGFAPTVNMRAGKKLSNFSRFDTSEFSVSLGIQSKF